MLVSEYNSKNVIWLKIHNIHSLLHLSKHRNFNSKTVALTNWFGICYHNWNRYIVNTYIDVLFSYTFPTRTKSFGVCIIPVYMYQTTAVSSEAYKQLNSVSARVTKLGRQTVKRYTLTTRTVRMTTFTKTLLLRCNMHGQCDWLKVLLRDSTLKFCQNEFIAMPLCVFIFLIKIVGHPYRVG